jgi:hypothetical protein
MAQWGSLEGKFIFIYTPNGLWGQSRRFHIWSPPPETAAKAFSSSLFNCSCDNVTGGEEGAPDFAFVRERPAGAEAAACHKGDTGWCLEFGQNIF